MMPAQGLIFIVDNASWVEVFKSQWQITFLSSSSPPLPQTGTASMWNNTVGCLLMSVDLAPHSYRLLQSNFTIQYTGCYNATMLQSNSSSYHLLQFNCTIHTMLQCYNAKIQLLLIPVATIQLHYICWWLQCYNPTVPHTSCYKPTAGWYIPTALYTHRTSCNPTIPHSQRILAEQLLQSSEIPLLASSHTDPFD